MQFQAHRSRIAQSAHIPETMQAVGVLKAPCGLKALQPRAAGPARRCSRVVGALPQGPGGQQGARIGRPVSSLRQLPPLAPAPALLWPIGGRAPLRGLTPMPSVAPHPAVAAKGKAAPPPAEAAPAAPADIPAYFQPAPVAVRCCCWAAVGSAVQQRAAGRCVPGRGRCRGHRRAPLTGRSAPPAATQMLGDEPSSPQCTQ